MFTIIEYKLIVKRQVFREIGDYEVHQENYWYTS